MSKLYQKYMSLKMLDSNKLYLFKSGIFYIFIDEDAKIMSPILNLKLTNLNSVIVKCGFPTSQIDKYSRLIKLSGHSFKIIDLSTNTVYLTSQYNIHNNIEDLLKKIANTDSNSLSISSAFEFIDTISKQCKDLLEDLTNGTK